MGYCRNSNMIKIDNNRFITIGLNPKMPNDKINEWETYLTYDKPTNSVLCIGNDDPYFGPESYSHVYQ